MERIETPDQAAALARHLLDPDRVTPVLVITSARSRDPYVDVDAIAAAAHGIELIHLPTGIASRAFADALADHPRTQVYGGAVRLYPVGQQWTADLSQAPIRFAYGLADRTRVTDAIIKDIQALPPLATPSPDPVDSQDLADALARAKAAEADVAKLKDQLRSVETALSNAEADRNAFFDPGDQLRFEIDLAWARRIPAAEKETLTRAEYTFGPQFLDTIAGLPDRDRNKAVDVILDILTGRVYMMPGRQTHQLRAGDGGNNPFVTRPDGATCWRVYLQHKTPQARRLHFWALPDGTIELSAVRNHDDNRP